jgi:hypothetical protein
MGLMINGQILPVCQNPAFYADDEITFTSVLYAEKLLERAHLIEKKTKKRIAPLPQDDLTKAVKKILES